MKKIAFILLFTTLSFSAFGQKSNNELRKSNKLYEKQQYKEAEIGYKKALEKEKESFEGNFNLGNALFRQERFSEAIEQYEKSQKESKKEEKLKQAAIWHNIGNSLMGENMLDQGIEAYKNALRNNPDDDETRYNLAFAQYLKKKMQKENEENKKDKDKEKEDQEKEQENKDKQGKDEQEKTNDDRQNKDEEDKDKQSDSEKEKKQQQPHGMTKDNAEQILRALLDNEKEVQAKINRQTLKEEKTIEKNW